MTTSFFHGYGPNYPEPIAWQHSLPPSPFLSRTSSWASMRTHLKMHNIHMNATGQSPLLSSSTHSTPSTLMPLTMPLLCSSLGGNEYIFIFADEISNPRCFFLLQRRFVQETSSVLMSPILSHLQASAMASGNFACLCSWILYVWLLRPASLTSGMDRQTHERLWIAGVTDHHVN